MRMSDRVELNKKTEITSQLHKIYKSLPCNRGIDRMLMLSVNILHQKYPSSHHTQGHWEPTFSPQDFEVLEDPNYHNSDYEQFGTYDTIK